MTLQPAVLIGYSLVALTGGWRAAQAAAGAALDFVSLFHRISEVAPKELFS